MEIERLYHSGGSLYLAKGKTFNSYRSAKKYLNNTFLPNEPLVEEPKAMCEDVEDAEPVDETSGECRSAKKQVIGKHSEKIMDKIEKKQKARGKVQKKSQVNDMVNELLSNQLGSGLKII